MPSAVDVWHGTTSRLATATAATVVGIYAAKELSPDEQVALQAAAIARAQLGTVSFNDTLLALEMSARLGQDFAPAGIKWWEKPDEQTARISKALGSVYSDKVAYTAGDPDLADQSVRSRLDRLAVGEVGDASQWSRQEAMIGHGGTIVGWYRRISPRACSFCRTLAGSPPENFIHPPTHRMGKHPHCYCSQGWVTEVLPGQKMVGQSHKMKNISPPAPAPAPKTGFVPITDSRVRGHIEKQLASFTPENLARAEANLKVYDDQIAEYTAKLAARKAELRDHYKGLGLKGPELTKEVNSALAKEYQVRQWKNSISTLKRLSKSPRIRVERLKTDRVVWEAQAAELDAAAAKAASLPRGAPMDVKPAALNTNLAYADGDRDYQINCTRCSATYELRRRGYDVIARPAGSDVGWSKHEPMIADKWRTATGERREFTDTPSRVHLDQAILAWPEGSRGFVVASWRQGGAHIFNVERTPGGYRFVEAQTDGRAGPLQSNEEYLSRIKFSRCGVLRVDDMVPTQDLATWVEAAK